jgi:hypothetical protein
MEDKERLQRKMEAALAASNAPKTQVLDESLNLYLSHYGRYSGPVMGPASRFDRLDAAKLLVSAHDLSVPPDGIRVQSFTMDELLDIAFPNQVLLSEHDVKVWAGRLLAAAGYERRQIRRRGGLRPLVWERTTPLTESQERITL